MYRLAVGATSQASQWFLTGHT